MKFVGILVAMAIICLLVVKRAQPSQVAEAMREADAVVQPVTSPSPAHATPVARTSGLSANQSPTGLRAPLDRTRAVLNQVKQRNGNDEL